MVCVEGSCLLMLSNMAAMWVESLFKYWKFYSVLLCVLFLIMAFFRHQSVFTYTTVVLEYAAYNGCTLNLVLMV